MRSRQVAVRVNSEDKKLTIAVRIGWIVDAFFLLVFLAMLVLALAIIQVAELMTSNVPD